jgi:hypothetical protein
MLSLRYHLMAKSFNARFSHYQVDRVLIIQPGRPLMFHTPSNVGEICGAPGRERHGF